MFSPRRIRSLATAFLFLLPLLVFYRPLFLGQAFLPADLLGHLWPYKAVSPSTTPWNVLRFDGITQFYPWRLEAARQINQGRIPLWNEFAFAAQGGTPLLANSQSAPLYPPNILIFAPLYRAGFFWYAFGLSAALHLLLAVKGMYHLLRAMGRSRAACLLGAATFGLSGPVITWLALPTFLCVAAWLPWLLLCIHRAHERKSFRSALWAGFIIGMTLLAGHLQIAFYVLLTGFLYVLWRGHFDVRAGKIPIPRWLGAITAALTLGFLLAAPQVLPALELSRQSARAAAGSPTMEGYSAYVANALPLRNLIALLVPDFFGHPNRSDGFYWNANNYAEWSYYVGVLPLCLAVMGVGCWVLGFGKGIPNTQHPIPNTDLGFFVILLLLSLLMAFGTWVNLPFFFLIPGYSQTGNPGRCLILVAFALAALAAFGMDAARSPEIDAKAKGRAALAAILVPALLAAIGASAATTFARAVLPNAPTAALLQAAAPDALRGLVLLVLAAAALAALRRAKPGPINRQALVAALAIALTVADLGTWGRDYNPTSPPSAVYPVTPGIAFLQQNAKDALIAPLNRNWSNGAIPPKDAVLPPNALTVYGLHDVAGYDSLFRAESKQRAKEANGGADPSPQENGNIVFTKSLEAAGALGAKYIVLPPVSLDLSAPKLLRVYSGTDMTIYENSDGKNYAPSFRDAAYSPFSFRVGAFCGILGIAAFIAGVFLTRTRRGHDTINP